MSDELIKRIGRLATEDGGFTNAGDVLGRLDGAMSDLQGVRTYQASGWTETGSASGSDVTATHAGSAGKTHHVTAVLASLSEAAIATLTLKDGASVIATFDVHNQIAIPLKGLAMTEGAAAEATLASGGLTATGRITLIGYTT